MIYCLLPYTFRSSEPNFKGIFIILFFYRKVAIYQNLKFNFIEGIIILYYPYDIRKANNHFNAKERALKSSKDESI